MTDSEKLRKLLKEAQLAGYSFFDDNLNDRIDVALAEPVLEMLTIDQHKDITQKHVDHCIYYRNLAIVLGAKPNQTLTDYDKELCKKGIDPDDNGGGYHWSVRDSLNEAEDLWEKNERLERERDEARAGWKAWEDLYNAEVKEIRGVLASIRAARTRLDELRHHVTEHAYQELMSILDDEPMDSEEKRYEP